MESTNAIKNTNKHYCRVCMANNRAIVDVFIFKNRIPEEIQFCTGVHIKLGDKLPSHICVQCIKDLSIAYNFKTKCIQSDIAFKSLSIKEELQIDDNDDHFKDGSARETYLLEIEIPKIKNESSKTPPRKIEIKTEFKRLQSKLIETQKLRDKIILKKPDTVNSSEEFKKPLVTLEKHNAQSLQGVHYSPTKINNSTIQKNLEHERVINFRHTNVSEIPVQLHFDWSKGIKNPVKNNNTNEENTKTVIHKNKLNNSQQDLNPTDLNSLLSKFKVEYICIDKTPVERKRRQKGRNTNCSTCHQSFNDWNALRRHQRAEHSEPCTCEICGKVLSSPLSLPSHMKTHGLPQFYCDVCNYNTFQKNCLMKHMNLHTGEYKYTCDYCQREFTFKNNLRAHIQRVHLKNEEKKFVCSTCNKPFSSRCSMERHIKSHLQIRSYSCDKCPSSFVHINNFKRHMKVLHGVLLPVLKAGRKRANPVGTGLLTAGSQSNQPKLENVNLF